MTDRPLARPLTRRRLVAWLARLGWMLAGVALAAAVMIVLAQRGRPELEVWHRVAPASEYRAGDPITTLAEYRAREQQVFAEVAAALAPAEARMEPWNRYRRAATKELQERTGGDRSFEIEVADPRGVAVLFHGLSDSPYAMQPLGRVLAAAGWHVVGIRLPGHGTVPAALLDVDWRDWRAVADLAVRDAASRGGGKPLVLAGFSTGAALALDATLRSLDDPSLPRPSRLIFLAPAIAVSPAAAVGPLATAASRLPGLAKLAWTDLNPEYDPFKYNSFPVNAGVQIHRLTVAIEERLSELEAAGRLGEIPPVLTIQSVVDSTVPPIPSLTRLYGRLQGAGNELLLFDVNRDSRTLPMLKPGADALLHLGRYEAGLPFTATVVTNAGPDAREVVARTRGPASQEVSEVPLGLTWPDGVYSLSHVAVPYPPDDPVYGVRQGAQPTLGSLELRGESSLLRVPPALLLRLRYNPFFPYLEERVRRFVETPAPPSTAS